MELSGRWVHFRIRDVFVPEPLSLLDELHGNDVLQGRVVAVTRSGGSDALFAVVEVDGYGRPMVVSADALELSFVTE